MSPLLFNVYVCVYSFLEKEKVKHTSECRYE